MQRVFGLFSISALIICTQNLAADATYMVGNTTVRLMHGDITKITGYDAIVNAANTMLSHGGGVALVIAQAAGPELQTYSFKMPSLGYGMGEKLKVGQAVITPAFKLEKNGVKWIIHAVGPQIPDGKKPAAQDAKLLYDAYFNSLLLAKSYKVQRIAFPSISTAIFNYDIRLATPIAKQAITDFITQYPDTCNEICFVLFTQKDYTIFVDTFLPAQSIWQRIVDFFSNFFHWNQA